MPPKVKFRKDEIVSAAWNVLRQKGAQALTSREIAAELGVSTRPIFTWFASMDELKAEVAARAKAAYLAHLERGLEQPIPFLGVWRQYLDFARQEPELYRFLFLAQKGGASQALRQSQELARASVMRVYRMDAFTADCYFRDLWLVAFSFATLIVTGNCSYTEEEIFRIGAEVSLAVCKAYKEIPGLPQGAYDRDAAFSVLLGAEAGVGGTDD